MTRASGDDPDGIGSSDPLMEAALEAARLLELAMQTLRGEPEPGFANKAFHAIRRIYDIDAQRAHGG